MTWSDSFCAVWRTATSGSSPTCRTTCSRRWSPARRPTLFHVGGRDTRRRGARHPDRRSYGRAALRGDNTDQRFHAHCERARVAGRALPDPGGYRGLGARRQSALDGW